MFLAGWIILGSMYFISVLLIIVGLFVGKSSEAPNSTKMKSQEAPSTSMMKSQEAPSTSSENVGCLCVFDIDRTTTAFGDCPGTVTGDATDEAWGCNKVTQIASGIESEIDKCKTAGCEIGIATDAGDATFDNKINDSKWKSLWNDTKVLDNCQPLSVEIPSYCQYAGGGDKGSEIQQIQQQYADDHQGVYPKNTYFYDDSDANLTNVCDTKLEGNLEVAGGGCSAGCDNKCCGLDETGIWERRKC